MKKQRSSYFIPFKKHSEFEGAIGKMFQGAFIIQQSSGIYSWLNLGLLSLEKLNKIIDKHLEKINAIKILAPMLQEANLWKKSLRFDEYGAEMLKIKDRNNHDFVFGPTGEELFTNLLTQLPFNKKNFPLILYNTQWKFRDEIRPRYGIIRGREFLMNDAYSFHNNQESLMEMYQTMFQTYCNIYEELGLNAITLNAPVELMGGYLSHEFLIPSEFGETTISFKKIPSTQIKWEERDYAYENSEGEKYIEIGHIYALGNKYSNIFKLKFPGTKDPMQMGCYGIGVSRILGIMFEKPNLGLIAPFDLTLLSLSSSSQTMELSNKIFSFFDDIIWDDREHINPGEKFAEADLIGSPIQVIIGNKEAVENKVTIKTKDYKKTLSLEDFFNTFATK